jgi:hypothetical protein
MRFPKIPKINTQYAVLPASALLVGLAFGVSLHYDQVEGKKFEEALFMQVPPCIARNRRWGPYPGFRRWTLCRVIGAMADVDLMHSAALGLPSSWPARMLPFQTERLLGSGLTQVLALHILKGRIRDLFCIVGRSGADRSSLQMVMKDLKEQVEKKP